MDKLEELSKEIKNFVDERDWNQFHSPANLSKSISIEANELLECFQWDEKNYNLDDVKEELADVINYCIQMAQVLNLDIYQIVMDKLEMIVYQGLIKDFHQDVINGIIADRIEDGFKKHGYLHNNPAEHRAFVNSLPQLDGVFDRSFGVNQDLTVAIEFQIPLTAKRIDFIICGKDENDNKNAVIIDIHHIKLIVMLRQ